MPNKLKVAVVGLGQRGLQHLKTLWIFQKCSEPQSITVHEFMCDKRPVATTCVVDGCLQARSVKHPDTLSIGDPKDNVWAKNST